jgi:hypothetical protein
LNPADRAVEARPIPWYWYLAAFVSYVALGFVLKSAVLNWIVGPTYLLVVLYLIPKAVRR